MSTSEIPQAPAAGLPRAVVVLVALVATFIVVGGVQASAGLTGPAFLASVVVVVVSPVGRRLRAVGVPGWLATVLLV